MRSLAAQLIIIHFKLALNFTHPTFHIRIISNNDDIDYLSMQVRSMKNAICSLPYSSSTLEKFELSLFQVTHLLLHYFRSEHAAMPMKVK